jgi:ABC-type transport system involved in Fe-S cluster assembly fused permease/ATPase subunit
VLGILRREATNPGFHAYHAGHPGALHQLHHQVVTNWRTVLRREVNELDSAANIRAVDSLINFETVKYFNNERWEHDRYDEQMQKWEAAQIKSQISLSWLNLGQSLIIAAGVTP